MRKTIMKKTTVKKVAAVVLAGAMCFGITNTGKAVTAKQNIRSANEEKKEADASSTVNDAANNGAVSEGSEAKDAWKRGKTVTGEAVTDKRAQLHNPVINASTGAVEFSYIYFGSYPQGEVTGEQLTSDIINAEYVSGDAVVNGEKYRRMTKEDVCGEYGTVEKFGKNKYRYFKYEPVKWKIIKMEGETAFVLSEYALNRFQYKGGRKWMNEMKTGQGFMGDAFSKEQQEAITYMEDRFGGIKENKINYIRPTEYSSAGFWDYSSVRIVCETDYSHVRRGRVGEERYCMWWLYDKDTTPYKSTVADDGTICNNPIIGWTEWGHFKITEEAYCAVVPSFTLVLTDTTLWDTEESLKKKEEEAQKPKPSTQPEPSTKPEQKRGDVNSDGEVDIEDAKLALRMALNLAVLEEKAAAAADMDEDGRISLKDAQAILKAALNLLELT